MSQGLCPSCGAAVKLTAGQTDTKCHYCDSVVTLQQAEAQASEVKHSKFAGTLMIAETAQEGGSYAEAINYFNKVIEQEPSFADAWLNKGICLVRTSKIGDLKIPEAISSWKAAIKFAKNPEAMKKRVATEINNVVSDFYPVLEQHYLQFHNQDDSLQEHGSRFVLLESALSLALELSPSATIAINGTLLCDRFIASIRSTADSNAFDAVVSLSDKDWKGAAENAATAKSKRRVADNLAKSLEATKAKYERVRAEHDPEFAASLRVKERKRLLEVTSKDARPLEKPAMRHAIARIATGFTGVFLILLVCATPNDSAKRSDVVLLIFVFLILFLGSVHQVVKNLRYEKLKNGRDTQWLETLPACFGTADLILASHPQDEERLLSLLEAGLKAEFPFVEIRCEIEKHLKARGSPAAHIRKQLERYDSFTQTMT